MIQSKTLPSKYRHFKDITRNSLAYIFSSFGVIMLAAILIFVFTKGYKNLSFGFFTGDFNPKTETAHYEESVEGRHYEDPHLEGVYFCENWGIGLEDSFDNNKEKNVILVYMDHASPFHSLKNTSDGAFFNVELGSVLSSGILVNGENLILASTKQGAKGMADSFKKGNILQSINISTQGGGIRGSLISTLWLIGLTLLFALPLGIGAAIYLSLITKNEKIKHVLLSLIDLSGGIPSIIYGLAGAIIFVPFLNSVKLTNGASLLSGALTMAILLLPTIIKTTIEAIKTVPKDYKSSSLALGASESQTIFKIILPNAMIGILSAVLLAIGRIIGESAALIYAVGTSIKDSIILTEGSATLAIHIWSLCAQENPNFNSACAVAIIILSIDLILNLAVKLISRHFIKKFQR